MLSPLFPICLVHPPCFLPPPTRPRRPQSRQTCPPHENEPLLTSPTSLDAIVSRRWGSNPSEKCSYKRPTRGTVCGTMRSMCGADANCLAINYQSLSLDATAPRWEGSPWLTSMWVGEWLCSFWARPRPGGWFVPSLVGSSSWWASFLRGDYGLLEHLSLAPSPSLGCSGRVCGLINIAFPPFPRGVVRTFHPKPLILNS